MGVVFRTLGNFNQAKKSYLKSLKIKNDDTITIYNYGNVLRITGDDELAQDQYSKVIKLK